MRTNCLHVAQSVPLQKVKKSWLPACVSGVPFGATILTTFTLCRCAPFPNGAFVAIGVPYPPKKARCQHHQPLRHSLASIVTLNDAHALNCRETLCRGRTSNCARTAKCRATTTPCPFAHCCKGGKLECNAMLKVVHTTREPPTQSYSFGYHVYVSGQRRAFVANGCT